MIYDDVHQDPPYLALTRGLDCLNNYCRFPSSASLSILNSSYLLYVPIFSLFLPLNFDFFLFHSEQRNLNKFITSKHISVFHRIFYLNLYSIYPRKLATWLKVARARRESAKHAVFLLNDNSDPMTTCPCPKLEPFTHIQCISYTHQTDLS